MNQPVLYVHVADDGGILTVDGVSGRSRWVTLPEFEHVLEELRAEDGSILVSSEEGSVIAAATLARIADAGLRVVRSPEVHPDARRGGGSTALMAMSYAGAAELVSDLIQRGAELDAGDDDGFTALMYASKAGHDNVLDLLVRAGADVNQCDHEGSTPLMFAAQHGHLKVVKKLLAAGADGTARRRDGLTAHDFAVGNGHTRAASMIMSAGSLRA